MHLQMNRGLLFSWRENEEIPGCCANCAFSTTLCELLQQSGRRQSVCIRLLVCKHGCVWRWRILCVLI